MLTNHKWRDSPTDHETVLTEFDDIAKSISELIAHRNWCVSNDWGYGHTAFHGLWYRLAQELPNGFKFLEIGIHRGQSLSAIDLAANLLSKSTLAVGLGPLDGAGGYYEYRDYEPDVRFLFDKFNGSRYPLLIRGLSQDEHAIKKARELGPYDVVYLDADHNYNAVKADLATYLPMVRSGGYFLSDDSGMFLNLPNYHFKGFEGASRACDEVLPPVAENNQFTYLFNLMHLKVWQKK